MNEADVFNSSECRGIMLVCSGTRRPEKHSKAKY
jgi:hypothetical protein